MLFRLKYSFLIYRPCNYFTNLKVNVKLWNSIREIMYGNMYNRRMFYIQRVTCKKIKRMKTSSSTKKLRLWRNPMIYKLKMFCIDFLYVTFFKTMLLSCLCFPFPKKERNITGKKLPFMKHNSFNNSFNRWSYYFMSTKENLKTSSFSTSYFRWKEKKEIKNRF